MSDEKRDPDNAGGLEPASAQPDNEEAQSAAEETQGAGAAAQRPAGSRGWLAFAVAFALLVAVLAAASSGFLWWQYREFYVSLHAADTRADESLAQLQASLRSLSAKLDGFEQDRQQSKTHVDDLDKRLDALAAQLGQLEQQLQALHGDASDVRSAWLRDEAQYYLRVANARLQLAHDWPGAIDALTLADGRLQELANPGLAPVRALIAEEIGALKAVQLPDLDGLSARLGALASSAADLPLRAEEPQSFAGPPGSSESSKPGLERLWAGIKRAFAGMIRIERRSRPVARALTEQQRRLIHQQLAVELQLAQVAAVRARPAMFRASIESARKLLEDDFDSTDTAVKGAVQELTGMSGMDIAPAAPDISQSLQRLRAAGGGN